MKHKISHGIDFYFYFVNVANFTSTNLTKSQYLTAHQLSDLKRN